MLFLFSWGHAEKKPIAQQSAGKTSLFPAFNPKPPIKKNIFVVPNLCQTANEYLHSVLYFVSHKRMTQKKGAFGRRVKKITSHHKEKLHTKNTRKAAALHHKERSLPRSHREVRKKKRLVCAIVEIKCKFQLIMCLLH